MANLLGAKLAQANVTEDQLGRASTLKGATMPDGQKYEDWLTNRERDKEDG